jgi:hypothetical protein
VLKGNEGPEMVCARCGKHFWPRCGGYWFLLLTPRGRCRMPHATEGRSVLCLGCGLPLREYLEAGGYTLTPAYDNVEGVMPDDDGCRGQECAGVSELGRG